jgi:serine/threonine-protein kinase RsbW
MEMILELEIPASAEYIAIARLVVSSIVSSRRNLPDDRIDDLKLAVSEACTNAIEAYGPNRPDDRVKILVQDDDEKLQVDVEDQGPGFDLEALPTHPPVTDPERLNFERGLGIPLIRTLVDDVEFESGDGGTLVRMTVYGEPLELHPPEDLGADADADFDADLDLE